MKKLAAVLFFTLFAANIFAVITTNSITAVAAPNGSIAIKRTIYDTDIGRTNIHLSFVDKKGKVFLDGASLDNYENILLSHFDGKTLILNVKPLGGSSYNTFIAYKVSKKGMTKLSGQVVNNNNLTEYLNKFITVVYSSGTMNGVKVFDKKLKKELYNIPPEDGEITQIYPNGVIVREDYNADGNIYITCYKKGIKVSSFVLTNIAGFFCDSKCGMLSWLTINGTNSTVSYLDKNMKKKFDNVKLDVSTPFWHVVAWDGKTAYIMDMDNNVCAYKIGKKTKQIDCMYIKDYNDIIIDKSKVYFLIDEVCVGKKYYQTNRKLSTKEFESPMCDKLEYLGKGVFALYNNKPSFLEILCYKNGKLIAKHTLQR